MCSVTSARFTSLTGSWPTWTASDDPVNTRTTVSPTTNTWCPEGNIRKGSIWSISSSSFFGCINNSNQCLILHFVSLATDFSLFLTVFSVHIIKMYNYKNNISDFPLQGLKNGLRVLLRNVIFGCAGQRSDSDWTLCQNLVIRTSARGDSRSRVIIKTLRRLSSEVTCTMNRRVCCVFTA